MAFIDHDELHAPAPRIAIDFSTAIDFEDCEPPAYDPISAFVLPPVPTCQLVACGGDHAVQRCGEVKTLREATP